MKRIAVIGIGHFGGTVAKELFAAGTEVIAIDADKESIQDAADFSTQAIYADATDKRALASLGLEEADAAIVSLGERMDVITLVALHLIELGIPYLVVKALSDDHAKILKAIGVKEIIHPEEDAARRLAIRMSMHDIRDFLPLMSGYSVVSLDAPASVVGKKVGDFESKTIQIVAIQHSNQRMPTLSPGDEEPILAGDILVLIGKNEEINGFTMRYCRD